MAYCFSISRLDLLDILVPALLLLETQRPASADGRTLPCLHTWKNSGVAEHSHLCILFLHVFYHFCSWDVCENMRSPSGQSLSLVPPHAVPHWEKQGKYQLCGTPALQPSGKTEAANWPLHTPSIHTHTASGDRAGWTLLSTCVDPTGAGLASSHHALDSQGSLGVMSHLFLCLSV